MVLPALIYMKDRSQYESTSVQTGKKLTSTWEEDVTISRTLK